MNSDNIELLLVLLGVFLVPLVLGHYISKAVRMPEQAWRIATVLFSTFAALAVTWYGWPPKLGIDLSGGSILVYEVDEQVKEPGTSVDMEKLVQAVTKRVNPGGVREVTIRPYGINQIEIIIPKAEEDELERIKNKISSTGMLEFRITANERDHANLIELAKQLDPATKPLVTENSDGSSELVAKWVPVHRKEDSYFSDPRSGFISRKTDKGDLEVLVAIDPQNVTGQYLRSAAAGVGMRGPKVDFRFDSTGSKLFGRLTSDNLPEGVQGFHRHLAILLDGYLYSAPQINEPIFESGEINGNFTTAETEDLASVLTAGSLPTALRKEPSSSLLTGATLGADTIQKGVYSMLVATTAVIIFMVIYYRFAGVVANIALLLNVLLIVAFMIMFNAAFTLSGLAGLALTVGMAVDANVLIYERMREELTRGATLRMAIRNGFEKATTTIIDANVTTLISAVVLYIMGTDQVKGFAVTLILGIVMNLFTAIFVSRVFFDIAEKTRFIKDLKMLHILSNPNFDFIGKRRIAIAISLMIIAIGMVGVVQRGKGLLDIDFTGGVSVQTLFDEPIDIAEVRDQIDNVRDELPDATVQDVRIAHETPGKRFVINTSNPKIEDVEAKLSEIFKGKLVVNHIEVARLDAIPAAANAAPADKKAAPAAETTPAETTAPAKATPEGGNGAQHRIRGGDELLLAMADVTAQDAATQEPPETEAAKSEPAAAPPKEDALSATKAEEQPAKAATPADTAAAAETPAKATGPALPAATGTATAVEPALASTRFAGGSEADITSSIPISHDRLLDLLQKAVATEAGAKNAIFSLDTPGYEPGSDASFEKWHVRTTLPADAARTLLTHVNNELSEQPYFPASSNIGAAVAAATQQQAAVAMFASLVLILAYIWFRFSQVMFGVAGVIAVVHDVLVTLGALALSTWLARIPGLEFLLIEPFKISLPIIAAFLTIIGYSLNDTIVIFDRIREMRGKSPLISVQLANAAINQTLSRTILTSLTVFIVVLILYIVGGEGIHGFAFALVVGVVAGSYSTIYIATPIVLWMNREELAHSKPALAESGVAQQT
ncbi:MAG TPA: protein translocase subunit SecD [Pirellulales bacterium]|nr:protein translocase subunit SecD [Pirellulales bacterium]